MNKEQFKNSIANLINYYTNSAVNYSVSLVDAEKDNEAYVPEVIQGQMQSLGYNFEAALNKIIDEAFPDEEDNEQSVVVEDENNVVE